MSELEAAIARLFPIIVDEPSIIQAICDVFNEKELWETFDFPHRPHHNLRVHRDGECIAALLKLDSVQCDLLEKGALVHDLGRFFVERGLITEEEHSNGSFVLAKAIAVLRWGFAEGIADYFAESFALHTSDVLPDVLSWVKALRDADRTSRLGMGGLIDLAWYLGYRDEHIAHASTLQIVDEGKLFDLNVPTSRGDRLKFDTLPRRYFDENVLPWVLNEGKLEELVSGVRMFAGRIYGVPTLQGELKRVIEPVSPEAQLLAFPRIESMDRFLKDYGFGQIPILNRFD